MFNTLNFTNKNIIPINITRPNIPKPIYTIAPVLTEMIKSAEDELSSLLTSSTFISALFVNVPVPFSFKVFVNVNVTCLLSPGAIF